jgi:hypothetical protein
MAAHMTMEDVELVQACTALMAAADAAAAAGVAIVLTTKNRKGNTRVLFIFSRIERRVLDAEFILEYHSLNFRTFSHVAFNVVVTFSVT